MLRKEQEKTGECVVHVGRDNSPVTVATVAELQVMLITPIRLL